MRALKIKKSSVFALVLTFTYIFVESLQLAGILTLAFIYLFTTRPVTAATLTAAGIPSLFAVFLVAALSSFMPSDFSFSIWDVAKDAYFFAAPMLLLVIGLTFSNSEADAVGVIRVSVYALTLASIFQYSDFLLGGELSSISLQSRYNYQLNSSASTLALLLILSLHPTLSSLFRSNAAKTLIALNLLLVVVSLSRTNLAISLFSLAFTYIGSRWLRGLIITGVLFLTLTPLMNLPGMDRQQGVSAETTFSEKIARSLSEFRVSNYSLMSDINNNWRGYEAHLAIQKVEEADGIAWLTGLGFGSYVVGPFDGKLEKIPFTHNGFVTIYLKAGVLGLIGFALFVFQLFALARSASREGRRAGNVRLTRAAGMINLMTISILITTLAAHGVYYSKTSFALFFIGLALCLLRNPSGDHIADRESDIRYEM